MRKKIIGMLICGIFFMTSFSSLYTNAKAICVIESSETQDSVCNYKIVSNSLAKMIGFQILFGDFYTEDNVVLGETNSMIIWELPSSPIPKFIRYTAPIYYEIYNDAPNLLYWKVRYSSNIVTLCYISV